MSKKQYGSLLSLDDLMTQIQGNTSTQDSFIKGVQKRRVDNNKSISTFEKDYYKDKIKFSSNKKEREDFEKALEEELKIEKVFEEQEKQLELQNRISKLSPEKQALYFEWKKKGFDKLEEIEKWNEVEKNKINAKNGSWRDRIEAASEENTAWKEAGDFSLTSPKSYLKTAWGAIKEVTNDIKDLVVNSTFRGNLLYEKRKAETDKYFDKIVTPLIDEKITKKGLEYRYIELKADKFDEKHKDEFLPINPYNQLLHQTADEIQDLQDAKERKEGFTGFFTGLYGNDIAPSGWKELQKTLNVVVAANNKEKNKNSEVDDMWLHTHASQEENKQKFKNPSKAYNTGQGVRHSVDFMGEMVLTRPISKGVASFLRTGIKEGAEKYLGKELLKEVSEETIELAAKKSLAKQGLEAGLKGLTGTAGMAVQSQFMTNTYTSGLEKMLGNNIQVIEDENGKSKVVVGKEAKERILKQAKVDLLALEVKEKKLSDKLTGDPQKDATTNAELEKVRKDKEAFYGVLNQIGTPAEDLEYGDAHLYGTIQTLGEIFSERYIGRGLDAIGGSAIMKGIGKIPGLKQANKFINTGADFVNNTISRISPIAAQALKHSGKSGKIINSLPSEMGEEVFVQLIPNNLDNYEEQLSHLTDPEFYKDIVLQTLIMGGGFGAIGTVANGKHHAKMMFNKKYAEEQREKQNISKQVKEYHKEIVKNINNPAVAKLLGQASSKGIYDMKDRMETILELEKEGNNKEALHIAEAGLTNMLHQATTTGNQSEFIGVLRSIVNDTKSEYLPDSLKEAAKNVFAKKNKYEDIVKKYGAAPNFNEIYEVLADVEDTKDLVGKIEQKNTEFLPKVQSTIDKLKEQGKISKDFTIDVFDFNNNKKTFNQAYFEGLQAYYSEEQVARGDHEKGIAPEGNIDKESLNQYAKDVNTIIEDLELHQEEAAQYFENLSGIEMAQQSNYDQLRKLKKITSKEYVEEFEKRNIQGQIDISESKEELKAAKEFYKAKGISDSKIEAQIEQREQEIELNLPPQNRVEENIAVPTSNTIGTLNSLEEGNKNLKDFENKKVIHEGKEYKVVRDGENSPRFVLESEDSIIEPTQQQINSLKLYETPQEKLNKKYSSRNVTETSIDINGETYNYQIDSKGNITGLVNNKNQTLKNESMLVFAEIQRAKLDLKKTVSQEEIETIEEIVEENPYAQTLLDGVYGNNMTETVDTGLEKLFNEVELNQQEKLSVYIWLEEAFLNLQKLRTKRDNILYKQAEDNLTIIAHLLYGNKQEIKKIQESSKINEVESTTFNEGKTTKQKREELENKLNLETTTSTATQDEDTYIPSTIEDFEGFPEFQSRYNSNDTTSISDKAVEAGRNVIEDIQKEKNSYPTFADFINYFIERHGKETIEKKFNGLAKVAKANGLDTSLANEYYDRTFNSTQTVLDNLDFDEQVNDTVVEPQQIEQQEREATKVVAQKNPVDVQVNTTTGEVKANTVVFNEDIEEGYDVSEIGELGSVRIATGLPKLAFNPTSEKGTDGKWKVNLHNLAPSVLGKDGLLVLDADYMHQVAKDSVEKPGSVTVQFTEDSKIIDSIPGLKEKLNRAKTPEERAMILPMIVIHETVDKNGDKEFKTFSFVHSYGWYTEENTADEATRIEGNENIKQLRLSLANNLKGIQPIQVITPRGVQYNSTNKQGNKELLPVSARNKQATIGFARYSNRKFSYPNAPEGLMLDFGNSKSENRDRIINIEEFEDSANAFHKNNPVIFHKVGVNSKGQNLYMINTLLSPYTYAPREGKEEREKNIANAKLPEDLKRTFEKALLGILLKSKKLNPKLKEAIDKIMPLSEQQNKKIQDLSTLDLFNKFIRVFNKDKNSSTEFREELKKYKKDGKKSTVFREYSVDGKQTIEMAFWDTVRQDYRIVNLETFTTGTLVDTEVDTKHLPEDFDALLNQMIEAMSVVNISATNPVGKTSLITKEGVQRVPTEDIYKDLLLTPLVSYEMENAKGETIEVFNIQPVIHFRPIESNGDIKDVSQDNNTPTTTVSTSSKTTLERAKEAAQDAKQEVENEQENSQVKQLQTKKDLFINGLMSKGYTEEKATQMYHAQLKSLGYKPSRDFESRNNVNTVEAFRDKDTLHIEGISIEEQKHLISYLKHNVLGSKTLKKLFNKNKLTLEVKKEIVDNIKNSLNQIEELKNEVKDREEMMESLGMSPDINSINLINKYEKVLENKDKIEKTLKQEIESLDIEIDSVDSLTQEEVGDENTSESFDKTNGEQNTKMQFGFALKASLYGIQQENKSGQQITGLLELPAYYSPDEVYDKMMEVIVNTSNNLEEWKKAFNSKYESSKVNGKITHNTTIYKNILNYLNSLPEERINELMTTLGSQAKLTVLKQNVSISQFKVNDKIYKTWVDVQILDENSSKAQGVIKRSLFNNFTNSTFGTFAQIIDGKLVKNEKYFKNTIEKLDKLITLPDSDSKKYDFKTLREMFDMLGFYGINDNTIEYIIHTRNSQGGIDLYGERNFFKPLLENLKNILNSKEDFLVYTNSEKSPYNNLISLNAIIKKEVELNNNAIASAIRVGEKTLQGTLQGTSVYDIAKSFLNDTEREKALKEFGQDLYTKNNILLEVIANSQKFRENFELAFNSPEVMKIHGKNVFGNSDIDEISNSDRLAFYFNMFTNTKGEILLEDTIKDNLNEKYVDSDNKLNFKIGKVPSLTLSDKGRILLIPSILVGLKAENLTIHNGSLQSLDSSVLNYVYNSVLKGELDRVIDAYKNNTGSNFKEFSKGSRLFSTLASLNGVKIDYTPVDSETSEETNIHSVIAMELRNNNKEIRPEVLEQIEEAIKEKFENYVKSEFNNKLKEVNRVQTNERELVEYEGELVEAGIVKDKVLYKDGKIVAVNVTKNGKTLTETMLSMVSLTELKSKPGNHEIEKLQHTTVEYIINNFVANLTNTGVFLKDPAFYHKSKVKTKLEKAGDILVFDKDTIKGFDNTATLVQLQKDIASNMQKRSALMIAPGYNLADSFNSELGDTRYATEMIHLAVQDVEMHSMMLEGMIKNHYGKDITTTQLEELEKLKKINNDIETRRSQLESTQDSVELQTKINEINSLISQANEIGIVKDEKTKTKVDVFEDLRPYFEITGTDAQEYSTWKTHLDTLYRKGKNGITKEQFKDLTHKFENNIDLTAEDLKLIFQPIKGVYTGSVFDKDTKKMRPVYIKSSVFPLLPQWVKGTPLDNVRKNLESLEQTRSNGHIDKQIRMSYQTANKIGSKNTALSMQFLYNSTPEQFKNSKQLESAKSILPMSGWRIQQETPSKEEKYFLKGKDARITLGSQFFKGIMGNFINKIPRKSFDNLFTEDILKLAGIDFSKDRTKLTGEELDKIYTEVYRKYSEIQLEQLEKELNLEDINNFYSPETTKEQKITVLKSLQRLLKREISKKGYPSYLKDSLDLIENELQFQSVLMFDNNRHKFEAMLQSIIANRLIVHTLPGNSHISASSEGFLKKKHLSELSAEDKSNIVWLNGNATGELKATYITNDKGEKVLVESEIAIQSHFKRFNNETGEYEYVNLMSDEYSEEVKNEKDEVTGRVLKKDKISPEMLSNFGFRIPTSSHQSGTILKVVAFLPSNVGDLVLVPKEQTTQLGEDYDVDKRYMYKANYIVDETGMVRELHPNDFELYKTQELSKKDKQDLLEEELENLKNKRKDLYEQLKEDETSDNLLKAIFGEESFQEGVDEVKGELKEINAKIYLARRINEKLKAEFEVKLLENAMINVYKSVYTSNDLEVQKKIYKPLITDVAEKSAKAIDKAVNSNNVNENFSMFSDSYQRYLMQLGADGKGGIGVHSNGVVLLAQLQRLSEDKKIQLGWFNNSWIDRSGQYYPASFKPFEILFNNKFIKNSFYGTLGKSKMTLDGKREVAEQPGENQNVSTDNINKGIMVLRNENSHTLDIYNMLALMEIDQANDSFTTVDKETMIAHVPSFLVSQPIMKRYVELKEKYKKLDSQFKTQTDIDEEIKEELFLEFTPGYVSFDDYNEVLNSGQFNSQLLYDMIKDESLSRSQDKIDTFSNGEVQWAIFKMLMDVKEQSDKLNKVRKLANLSTSKLGISYFETIDKMKILKELQDELEQAELAKQKGEIDSYNNWLNIIGDVKDGNLEPTTIEGIQLLNALKISNKLMPILFNYENTNILNGGIIDKIFHIEEKEITSTSEASKREKYKIMSEFTNFINSGMGVFEGNTFEEISRLTKTEGNNKSLGYILQDLLQKRHPIMQNYLLKDLQVVTNAQTGVSVIKHTAQDVGTLEDNNKINAFLDLLKDDTVLGNYNGENLTVANLAKDLISYSILADNQNGATGYRQFIPVQYLELTGFSKNVRDFNSKLQGEYLESIQERFVQQYFQHNPDKIKYKDSVKGKPVVPGEGTPPKYALVRDSGNNKKIFKWNNSTKSYEEIPVLGSQNNIDEVGINEYDFNKDVNESVFKIQEQSDKKIIYHGYSVSNVTTSDLNYSGNLNRIFKTEEMLKGDANAIKSLMDSLFANPNFDNLNPGYREAWELYKSYLNKDVQIKFEIPETYKNNKSFEGAFRYGENTIYINPNVFDVIYDRIAEQNKKDKKKRNEPIQVNTLFKEFRRLMMEEVLHSIQVAHLEKGFNTPQGKAIREYYQKAMRLGIDNPALRNTGDELVDVAEFIAGIYHDKNLREELNKADKGFVDRFLNALKRLMQELIPGNGFDKVHHNMIEMIKQNLGNVNFLESQQVAQEVKEVKKELTPSEKLNEIRKDDVQLTKTPTQAIEGNNSLIEIAKLNKGKQVSVKYDKYKQPFSAIITGEVEQVVSPTELRYDDGRVEYKDDGVYAIQIKTNTGKMLAANLDEITGLSLQSFKSTSQNKDFESRNNLSNFAEEAFECK